MLIIIDAYNVLKQISSAQFIEEGQRNAFIKKLEKYAYAKDNRVVLVFDGGDYYRPTTYKYGQLSVIYAGQQDSADDVIKQFFMRGDINPSQTILVSSDRDLCLFVGNFRVHSIDSYEFYKMLDYEPEQKVLVMQKASGKIKKLEGIQTSAELDQLMEEASRSLMYKTEDDYAQDRKSSAQQATKQEKKIKRLVKKL